MNDQAQELWLILDGSACDRRRLKSVAEATGAAAVLTSSMTESLEVLEKRPVTVCLLEYFLRGKTCSRLVREIRSRIPHMPIVIVSGHAGTDQPLFEKGADAVVPKISDFCAFQKVIRSAIDHARFTQTEQMTQHKSLASGETARSGPGVSNRVTQEMLNDDLVIDDGCWLQLLATIRNGTFEQAEHVVREMMVKYATINCRGNKTKIAEQLGISRQCLYKERLRSLHPNRISRRSEEREPSVS